MLTLHPPPHPYRKPPLWAILVLLIAVGVLLICESTAHAAPARYTSGAWFWTETQALTRAAPSSTTDGMDLTSVMAYRISLCAASGQTLTGGALQFWAMGTDSLWGRNPLLDLTVTGGQRCQVWGDYQVAVPIGRMLPANSGVTVSGGTTATVRLEVVKQ
jgi:hypothetical protein